MKIGTRKVLSATSCVAALAILSACSSSSGTTATTSTASATIGSSVETTPAVSSPAVTPPAAASGSPATSAVASGSAPASAAASGSAPASSGKPLSELNIGVFIPGLNNTYLQAMQKGAQAAIAKFGIKATIFTGNNFDSATQTGELQLALQRNTFNAWVVAAVNADDQCTAIKQAAAKIPVITVVTAVCGSSGYTPGTVSYVSEQDSQTYAKWWQYILKNTTPGEIANFTGPPNDFIGNIENATYKATIGSYTGFKLVSNQTTDYQTSTAFADSQVILKAHPSITGIITDYTALAQGAAQAVAAANRTSNVKVYSSSGSSWDVSAVKAGKLQMFLPGLPYSDFYQAIELMTEKWQGKVVPTVYNPLTTLTFPGAPFVTAANVAQFTPQY
jgi:ABC-type sugar transport system substrate-binding protein